MKKLPKIIIGFSVVLGFGLAWVVEARIELKSSDTLNLWTFKL